MKFSLALAALSAAASGVAAVVDPALAEPTDYAVLLDAKVDGSPTGTPGKMSGLASLKPAFVASLKASAGVDPFALHDYDGGAAGAVVQTTFVTNTTRLHVDHLPPDEDGMRRPVPAGDLVTLLPLETNKRAYFDVDAKCFSIKKGHPIHFEGSHPHRTVVKSGSVCLLGPFHTKTLKSVGVPPPTPPPVPPPGNDLCADADLVSAGSTVPGTTLFATSDDLGGCAASGEAPTVWYQVTGTGNAMTASTCSDNTNYDTELSVFKGGCGDARTCVTFGDQDGSNCAFSGDHTTVDWCSEAGEDYLVAVHGFISDAGDFELDISESDPCTIPENDECADADLVSAGSTVSGTTVFAATDDLGSCFSTDTPTVWYKTMGTGNIMTASTCDAGTNFDTVVSIFADGCDQRTCVAANGDAGSSACGINGAFSVVDWCSEAGEEYLIAVHGFTATGGGDFVLDISDGAPCTIPANDECVDAISVPVPSTESGTTQFAGTDDLGVCFNTDAPTVWYKVTGTGTTMTASTCSDPYIYDTALSVFCNGCDEQACVGANDDACAVNSFQSTVDWCGQDGAEYLVAVHGFSSGSFGDFTLDISDDGISCNPLPDLGCSIKAPIDIKFCSNPNGFNCKAKGVLPMTVFGTDSLDVEDIDIATIQLCLADDLETCIDSASSLLSSIVEDRGDPLTDLGASECVAETFDIYPDLELAWEAEDVVETLLQGCVELCNGGAGPTFVFKAETLAGDPVKSFRVDDAGIDQLFIQKGAPVACEPKPSKPPSGNFPEVPDQANRCKMASAVCAENNNRVRCKCAMYEGLNDCVWDDDTKMCVEALI